MPKLMASVAAGAALCAVLASGWALHLSAENKRLGERVEGLAADLAAEQSLRAAERLVSSRQATRLAALTTKQRETNAKLQDALRGSAAWAAEPVPAAVADALGLPVSAEAPAGKPAE